jgi:hypothetical protein
VHFRCETLNVGIEENMSAQPHNFEFLRYPASECSRLVVSYCVECHQIIAASPRMETLEIVEDLHYMRDEEQAQ